MNDRLRIASEQLAALHKSQFNRMLLGDRARIALDAVDAILAAAGEHDCAADTVQGWMDRAVAAEAKCADLERENAALRRRAEPLTEEESEEATKYIGELKGNYIDRTIQAVAICDRIRSRRSSDG